MDSQKIEYDNSINKYKKQIFEENDYTEISSLLQKLNFTLRKDFGLEDSDLIDILNIIIAKNLPETKLIYIYEDFLTLTSQNESFELVMERFWNIFSRYFTDLTVQPNLEVLEILIDRYMFILKCVYKGIVRINLQSKFAMGQILDYYSSYETDHTLLKKDDKYLLRYLLVMNFTEQIFGLKPSNNKRFNSMTVSRTFLNPSWPLLDEYYKDNLPNLTFAQNWLEKQKKLASDNT